MNQVEISIIIPTFNEGDNIGQLLIDLNQGLDRYGVTHEIIVVDDNSPDDTVMIVSRQADRDRRIKLVSRRGERGIGSAIYDGLKRSSGKIIITMDADFSHPPESVIKLVESMKNYDLSVGSRYVKGGKMNGPFTRRVLSRSLNKILVLILGLHVHDCTGGFLALGRKVLNSIDKIESRSGDFSFEIIYKAKIAGFKITEIPFEYKWRTKGKTKTKVFKFGVTYLLSAINLKLSS